MKTPPTKDDPSVSSSLVKFSSLASLSPKKVLAPRSWRLFLHEIFPLTLFGSPPLALRRSGLPPLLFLLQQTHPLFTGVRPSPLPTLEVLTNHGIGRRLGCVPTESPGCPTCFSLLDGMALFPVPPVFHPGRWDGARSRPSLCCVFPPPLSVWRRRTIPLSAPSFPSSRALCLPRFFARRYFLLVPSFHCPQPSRRI